MSGKDIPCPKGWHCTCHHQGWMLCDPPRPGKGWGWVRACGPLRWVTPDLHGLGLSCSPAQDQAGGGWLCCRRPRGEAQGGCV